MPRCIECGRPLSDDDEAFRVSDKFCYECFSDGAVEPDLESGDMLDD